MTETVILIRRKFRTYKEASAALHGLAKELGTWLTAIKPETLSPVKASVWLPTDSVKWHADVWVVCAGTGRST